MPFVKSRAEICVYTKIIDLLSDLSCNVAEPQKKNKKQNKKRGKNKSNWMSKFKSWVGLRRKVNWVLHPPTCGCVNSYLDLQYEVDLNDLLSFTNYSLCLYPINFCNSEYIPISKILRKFRTQSELKYQQIADFHIKRALT